jgi:putative endonuclease
MYGHPLEAITPAKQARLRTLAGMYLAQLTESVAQVRIDAVSVIIPPRGAAVVEHIQGVA